MTIRLGAFALLLSFILSACQKNPADFANGNFITYRHDLDVGASGRDLLNSSKYKSLVVEIQYLSPDYVPDSSVVDHFRNMLTKHLSKPNGISVTLKQIPPSSQSFGVDQIKSIEETSRTIFTTGDKLSVYILYLPGYYATDSLVLGAAYRNTSIAVFGKSVSDFAAGDSLKRLVFDATILEHEFGHLMGLVDEGIPLTSDHLDAANGHHCTSTNCLMYYAFLDSDHASQYDNGLASVPVFDDACIADLQAVGGK